MHRYDPYAYNPRDIHEDTETGLIDGVFYNMKDTNPSSMHRFRNVEKLAISLHYFDEHASELTNTFTNIQHLSIVDGFSFDGDSIVASMYPYTNMKALPRLQSICFVHIDALPEMLRIMKPYATAECAKLKSISFVDCQLPPLGDYSFNDEDAIYSEYKNMLQFLLPSQPNNLQVLRLENSFCAITSHSKCDDAN
eukprot:191239_1